MIRYVMISSEVRNDLEAPMRFFRDVDVHHLYRRAPWNDMRPQDFGPHTVQYTTPWALYSHLRRIQPHAIQGPEPLSLLMFPFLVATFLYLRRHPEVPLIAMSQETVPLDRKYGVVARLMKPVVRHWFQRASALLWLDPSSRANMRALGADEAKLRFLLYGSWGVDFDVFSPEGPSVDLGPKPAILHVGRLVPEKGAKYLIDAFAEVRRRGIACTLSIVGDGPERLSLEQQSAASGFGPDIHFWGGQKNVDVPPYFRAAQVLVLPGYPSRFWVQHISMTAWQAMRCGLPIIATDVGEMAFFTPPEVGVLVPPRDAHALADALVEMLVHTDGRQVMADAAVQYSTAMFDVRKNVAEAERLVLEVVKGRQAAMLGTRSVGEPHALR